MSSIVTKGVVGPSEDGQRLREGAWLKALVDSADVGLLAFDTEGRVTCNRRALELLGERACRSVSPDDDGGGGPVQQTCARLLAWALGGETVRGLEMVLPDADGTGPRHVLVSAVPVRAPDGTMLGALEIFDDVTHLKREQDRQRFLAEAGTVLVEELELERTLERVLALAVPTISDACIAFLGDADSLRPAVYRCAHPDRQAALAEVLATRGLAEVAGGALEAARERRTLFRAQIFPAQAQSVLGPEVVPLFRRIAPETALTVPLVARDRVQGVITFFTTSGHRPLTTEDAPVAEGLARIAALAVDNAALYRAERQATAARDEVLGMVAHDLRSPLSAISVRADLLGRDPTSPETPRRVAAMQRGLQQMQRLIDDLLEVHRIEGGGLPLDKRSLRPDELVAEAVEATRPIYTGVAIDALIESGLPAVLADRGRMLQVLGNLIHNAARFTPAGGWIRVEVKRADGQVLFLVADSGSGMAPDVVARAFDPFFQAFPISRGAGLGLSICRGIVCAHGGRMWVQSTPGAGTVVSFTLGTSAI